VRAAGRGWLGGGEMKGGLGLGVHARDAPPKTMMIHAVNTTRRAPLSAAL